MQNNQTLFSRLFGNNDNRRSQPAYSFNLGSTTRTGEQITGDKALKNSTVFSCVNVIADNIAQLDWGVMRENNANSTRVAYPVLDNVLRRPNDISTPYELKHSIVANILLYGNAYLLVTRTSTGVVASLTPLDPTKVVSSINAAGRAVYSYRDGDNSRQFRPGSIVHFRDFALNGVEGLSRVEQCADLIAQANAIEYLTADVFRNGNGVGGVISSEAEIPPEVQEGLQAAWENSFGGQRSKSRQGLAILGGGLDYQQFNPLKPSDADLQNMKKLVIAQICGVFRVPASMIEQENNNKYSNVSQKQTSFFRDTIAPMVKNIEERLTMALVDDPNLYLRFDTNGIQKGDKQTQMTIAVSGVANGIITPNEARTYLDYNVVNDEGADTLRTNTVSDDSVETTNDEEEVSNEQS